MAMMPPAFRPKCLGPKREVTVARDARRGSPVERGYDARHARESKRFRRENPLCCCCKANGVVAASEVLDHIVPHKGDEALLRDPANWQALCHRCHRGIKQRLERLFFAGTIGVEALRCGRQMPDYFDLSGIEDGGTPGGG